MRLSSLLHLISTTIAFCVAIALCAGTAHAQQEKALTGKWNMVSSTPNGSEVNWTLSITYKDGGYSATLGSEEGETAAKNFKVEGSKIHLRVTYEGEEYDIDLKLVDGKLVGTWSGNQDTGQTKGEKASG